MTGIVELMTMYPRLSIIFWGIVVTLISTLLTKWLTDQQALKALKERQKELNAEMKKHKDNPKMMEEMQMEVLKITGSMMKSSFKPLFITFIPFLILFAWLRSVFTPLMGFWGWFLWYLGASIISGMIFRKVFKLA